MSAINNPKASKVLGTKNEEGDVHMIPVGSIMAPNPNVIAFGQIMMRDAGANLERMKQKGEMVSILVIQDLKAYQVRGKVKDAMTSGPLFDRMNEVLKALGFQASTVWTVEPMEVWNQSASYEAGKKMV